jgi:DNA gyrase subunit A
MVRPDDEVFAITSNGGVIRTRASEVRQTGRVTMGVRLMNLASGDTVVALARNAESAVEDAVADDGAVVDDSAADDSSVEAENPETTEDIADDGNESGDIDV